MPGQTIYLFMWAYQTHYRASVQWLARAVLKQLGSAVDSSVVLVGARSPDSANPNPVCIEPEDGKWQLSTFDGLLDSVESIYKKHGLQSMCYGDEPSMRDKPEWMRRDSVRTAVENSLKAYDLEQKVTSFCGQPRRVGDYYVTPVVQVSNAAFLQFPPLPSKPVQQERRSYGYRSLIHAAMGVVLREAAQGLEGPEPGRSNGGKIRSAEEVVRIAAREFLHTPGLSVEPRYFHSDLFELFNLISSLMYEGVEGVGHLILIDPESKAVDFLVQFVEPVSLRDPRWVRKVLQMSTVGVGIIADSQRIYGLGRINESYDPSAQDAFIIDFLDHYHWELRCGAQVFLCSRYGVPTLPQEPFEKAEFLANYYRLFPASLVEDGQNLWTLLHIQINLGHGSMLVVSDDAASEALRLCKEGTSIVPVRLSEALLRSVSGIDGTILLDPHGMCHAIGVILDGEANADCTPSRGSRYNSGVRYVRSTDRKRLAIVVSDDRTVDIIPALRPLISRSVIERHIEALEVATLDNYHEARNWLDSHRFYLSPNQCERINFAISRLDDLPKDVGRIYFETEQFEAHSGLDESYLIE